MKKSYLAYALIVFVLCLIPSVGLLFGGGEVSSDADAAPAPSLTNEDGGFNVKVMSDAGDWFEDHFAFRNEYITAWSTIADGLLKTSSNDQVIQGTDGWLYYGNSLGDYQGTNHLTDRQLFDIAHSMKLAQDYLKGQGADFVFAVAPNKSSLYGDHMPLRYRGIIVGERNLARLVPYLREEGVNYVDLYGHFLSQDETLYHATDSHWNNKGASQAAAQILSALGKKHPDYTDRPYTVRNDFTGDLEKMLFPAAPATEDELYFEPAPEDSYTYNTEIESTFDPFIQTTAAGKAGSLLMYRDSFGNALLPFMAENYRSATFSRGVPYDLHVDLTLYQPDTVVVERAERFLSEMVQQPPVVPGRYLKGATLSQEAFTTVDDVSETAQLDGSTLVTGAISKSNLEPTTRIYIRVDSAVYYEAFGYTDGKGNERFSLLLPPGVLDKTGNTYEVFLSTKDYG